MKSLMIIPIQSVSDIITNSSSELFIVNNEGSLEVVKTTLSRFEGCRDPFIFSLAKMKELKDSGEYIEDKNYRVIDGWFYDLDYPEDSAFAIKWDLDDLVCPVPWNKAYKLANYRMIRDYRKLRPSIDIKRLYENECPEYIAFIHKYWHILKKRMYKNSFQYLDGKVIIISTGDNDIPDEQIEEIEEIFKADRRHLG